MLSKRFAIAKVISIVDRDCQILSRFTGRLNSISVACWSHAGSPPRTVPGCGCGRWRTCSLSPRPEVALRIDGTDTRHHQSQRRIMVEYAIAEPKHWRSLQAGLANARASRRSWQRPVG